MATRQTRTLARFMMAPSVICCCCLDDRAAGDDAVVLVPELQFAQPGNARFRRLLQLRLFLHRPGLLPGDLEHADLVVGVLFITVIGGILLALLLDQPIFGQGIVRILVISPFFVMPPVAALVWKNMIMHPGYGVLRRHSARFFGLCSPSTGSRSIRCSRSSSSSRGSGCPSRRSSC
jgi:sorbitol/mannitol transport system permease protein